MTNETEAKQTFSAKEWQRYQRHIQLSRFGVAAQTKLKQAHVVIIGMGGLGCPAAQYLTATGVGKLTLVDADIVSRTNLQRQVLFGEADIGLDKVSVAKQRLHENNPFIDIVTVNQHLSVDNAVDIIGNADLVIDCCDNFTCRYLINDVCLKLAKPWIFASIGAYSGQLALFTEDTACFRCLFPKPPTDAVDCNTAGVLGVLPGSLGVMQATEAIKYLTGLNGVEAGKLILVEPLYHETRHIQLGAAPHCRCENRHKLGKQIITAEAAAACEIKADNGLSLTVASFEESRKTATVIDVRSQLEHNSFNIGGDLQSFQTDAVRTFAEDFAQQYPNKHGKYLIYCQSGVRSDLAVNCLIKTGYQNVYSLKGGLAQWLADTL